MDANRRDSHAGIAHTEERYTLSLAIGDRGREMEEKLVMIKDTNRTGYRNHITDCTNLQSSHFTSWIHPSKYPLHRLLHLVGDRKRTRGRKWCYSVPVSVLRTWDRHDLIKSGHVMLAQQSPPENTQGKTRDNTNSISREGRRKKHTLASTRYRRHTYIHTHIYIYLYLTCEGT